jgi:hypothetical protein
MSELDKEELCCGLQTRMAGDESQDLCNRTSLQIAPCLRVLLPSSPKTSFERANQSA